MKKLLNILLLVCINYTVNAQITPDSFTTPVNTGANMTVFLNASKFDQFEGGQIGAFYDLNGDGVLQCVGVESIAPGFSWINLWGDDLSTPAKDGLGSGESPGFAILYDGNVILVDEYPQFTGYMTNGFVDITDASFSGMGCYDGNNHYLPGSNVCFVSSSCYCDDNNVDLYIQILSYHLKLRTRSSSPGFTLHRPKIKQRLPRKKDFGGHQHCYGCAPGKKTSIP